MAVSNVQRWRAGKTILFFPLKCQKNKNSQDIKLDRSASLRVIHSDFSQLKLLGRRTNTLRNRLKHCSYTDNYGYTSKVTQLPSQ